MSFDLCVWHADAAPSVGEAGSFYDQACEGAASFTPSEQMERFAERLLGRFPNMADDDDGVWSVDVTFEGTGLGRRDGYATLCIRPSKAAEVLDFVRSLVSELGLVCYDPQAQEIYP